MLELQFDGIPCHIRWMVRRDMTDVLRIENLCFEFPWSDDDFLCCLRQRTSIGMVAERCDNYQIAGFMIYELHKGRLELLSIAVDPKYQRRRVGAWMVQRLVDKLSQQRRTEISATVRETNLQAQLFFREQGFRSVSTLRGCFEETGEDGYVFLFKQPLADPLSPFSDRRLA